MESELSGLNRKLLAAKGNEWQVIIAARCSECHRRFYSGLPNIVDAGMLDIIHEFDAHICNEDVNQASARIVGETTSGRNDGFSRLRVMLK